MARIVSLVPGITELLAEVGLAGQLVGRSHRCLSPTGVQKHPSVTVSKGHTLSGPVVEDTSPEGLLATTLAQDYVLLDELKALKPDYIIAQPDLGGTSVSTEGLKDLVKTHVGASTRLETVEGHDLPTVLNNLQRIADLFGMGSRGKSLVDKLRQRMDQLYEQAKNAPRRRRALVLSSLFPLVSAGNCVPRLLETTYMEALWAKHGEPSRRITWQQVIAADPDLIVLALAETTLEEAQEALVELHTLPELRTLRAYRARQLYLVDGERYILPQGPSLLESAEVLAEIGYPELFGDKRLGRGWYEAV